MRGCTTPWPPGDQARSKRERHSAHRSFAPQVFLNRPNLFPRSPRIVLWRSSWRKCLPQRWCNRSLKPLGEATFDTYWIMSVTIEPMGRRVFITGSTGYMGSRLIPCLEKRGHKPLALVRASSRHKLPDSCECVVGDPLAGSSYKQAISNADTFVHLVGVSHPGPAKAREFVEIDRKSAMESIAAAKAAHISHFVYLSVAHPAPVMKAYIDVRMECEQALASSGMNATILRPWYVLGPGHYWPYTLVPFYKLAELVPGMREGASRLGLVTIREMVAALVQSIENPARGQRIWQPKDIRSAASALSRLTGGAHSP